MKQKHFYQHLIQINEITLDLGELDLSNEERLHLISLLEANIHSVAINTILLELSEKDKKIFLSNLVENNHDKIWEHLWKNSVGIEEKIIKSAESLIKEMRADITKVKKSK
jgi:hypothetical protein